MNKLNEFQKYSKNINWFSFILISFFSISSWVCSNAIWSELPAFIDNLPEKWGITSVLTLLSQIVQLFIVILFFILNKSCPTIFTYQRAIYFKLIAEALTMCLLYFNWNKTAIIFDKNISIGLYISYSMTSLLDGLSTMIYLPYIAEFYNNDYIMPNYIGEAVSSSIPSAIVFFQNIPNNEHFCKKNNESLIELNDLKLNFSVSNYFGLNGLFIIAYLIAFIFIDRRKLNKKTNKLITSTELEEDRTESEEFIKQLNKKKEFSIEKFFLLSIIFLLCLLMYGVLPGIQTFSTLPYGDLEFNLSINLGNVILPLAIVLSIFTNDISLKRVFLEFLVGGMFSGYLIYISIASPCPILVGTILGSVLSVGSWILVECIFIRLRFLIAKKLENLGTNMLTLGIISLLGQIIGGLLVYICIHTYKLLKEKPACVYDFSYCSK